MENMSQRKGTKPPTPYKGPKPPMASQLITQFEFKLMWVILDTAIENGAYDHDEDIKNDHLDLREKLRVRGNIK
jgi:hypothetical protein